MVYRKIVEIMITNYRIVQILCLLATVAATIATIVFAISGDFVVAAATLVAAMASFIGCAYATKRIAYLKQIGSHRTDRNIKPI